MIDKDQARELVEEQLKVMERSHIYDPIEYIIVDEYTIEEDFGWVFFYQSKKYVETEDFQYILAGNAPIIVDKRDGSLHDTGTGYPVEYYIENYRKTGRPYG